MNIIILHSIIFLALWTGVAIGWFFGMLFFKTNNPCFHGYQPVANLNGIEPNPPTTGSAVKRPLSSQPLKKGG
jgi:hypothetical protein